MKTAWRVAKGVWHGKSNARILLNEEVARQPALPGGVVLDIGAGKNLSSTFSRLSFSGPHKRVALDLDAAKKPDIVCDPQSGLPLPNGAADAACLFNVVYAFRDPVAVLKEVRRVLRPGARIIFNAPLIFNEAPEPHDFLRYTREGIVEQLLKPAGFTSFSLHPFGGRASAAAFVAAPILGCGLGAAVAAGCVLLDRWIGERGQHCPIGYLVAASK